MSVDKTAASRERKKRSVHKREMVTDSFIGIKNNDCIHDQVRDHWVKNVAQFII